MIRSPATRKAVWQARGRAFGDEHPTTRAAFGRYVGSLGGAVTAVSSGQAAWVGCYRQRGLAGFHNRGYRKYLSRRQPPGSLHWAWQTP